MLFSDWRAEGPRELVGNLLCFLGPQLGVGTLSLSPTLPLVKANHMVHRVGSIYSREVIARMGKERKILHK